MDRVVGTLDNALLAALNVPFAIPGVVISPVSLSHIVTRRRAAGAADVDMAANRLGEALGDVRYYQPCIRTVKSRVIIGFVASANRYLKVVLKFVQGAESYTGNDECWVSTAYPTSLKEIRPALAKGKLLKFS